MQFIRNVIRSSQVAHFMSVSLVYITDRIMILDHAFA